MLLVNIGAYTLNVERAVAFLHEEDRTTVIFAGIPGDPSGFRLVLEGEDSRRLQIWLRKNSEGHSEEAAGFTLGAGSNR